MTKRFVSISLLVANAVGLPGVHVRRHPWSQYSRGSIVSLTFALQSNFAGEGMGKSNPLHRDFSGKSQSEDLPSSITCDILAFCCCLVLAQHKSEKGWQGPPLFQHRGEPAFGRREDDTKDGLVSGRDQRPTTSRVAQVAGGLRRTRASDAPTVSLFPDDQLDSSRRRGQLAGEVERD